jgi:hypothetical protein
MVSTPTTRLRLEKQSLGSNLNVWGDTKLNDALDRVDEAIGGVQAITISGAATTLTSTNYATDQARKAALVLTGTLSANSTITVPHADRQHRRGDESLFGRGRHGDGSRDGSQRHGSGQ